MTTTALHPTAWHFEPPLPLNLDRIHHTDITGPFQETTRHPAGHDMLMLATHPDLLPDAQPVPLHDLNFFNLDLP